MPRRKTQNDPIPDPEFQSRALDEPESTTAIATPEPVDTPSPEPEPSPEPSRSLRDVFAERGYDTSSFADDASLAEAAATQMDQLAQQQAEYQRMSPAVQDYLANQTRFQEWQNAQTAIVEPAKEAEKPKSSFDWKAPEYDPDWAYLRDDQGNWRRGVDPSIPAKYDAGQRFLAKTIPQFFRNPQEVIHQAMADELQTLREEMRKENQDLYQQQLAQQNERQQMEQFIAQRANELFQTGQDGQPLVNQMTNNYMLTPKANAMVHYADQLKDRIPDASFRVMVAEMFADRAIQGQGGGQPTPAPAPNGSSALTKKQRFIDRVPPTEGAPPEDPTARVVNPEAALNAQIRAEYAKRGIR